MTPARGSFRSMLLPLPKKIREDTGVCRVFREDRLGVHVDDPRVEQAARRWQSRCPERSTPREASTTVRIAVDQAQVGHRHGYRLTVRTDGIELLGGSAAGCFYGLQTLTQLTDFSAGEVPCCVIDDRPDFATRGLLHDVTRGKVPTLDTLKTLADRLAAVKVNQLQLYIEHAFTFAFDPDICGPADGLTPDEIRQLDAYCKDRFIDLVPAVATLGHMGRILSMPRYRHLAEIEPTQSWAEMTWLERARGFTLDIINPESHALVERISSEILDAFSSPVVNICGDEPWDLGKGKNREHLATSAPGGPYIDHILRTHALCAARGRRTQVWSDVVRNHPGLLHRLPKDLTVLHWGYDDRADYDGTRAFTNAGLDTMVCPGTSGWKRIINAMGLAERNIAAFAAAGRKHGATGLLNTDWGDHGHFNPLACSWHGIALGAARAWNADHPIGPQFDRCFARTVLGLDDVDLIADLRRTSAIADRCETWRLLWQPFQQVSDDPTLPRLGQAEQAFDAAQIALTRLRSVHASSGDQSRDLRELTLACEFAALFAEKVRHARASQARAAGFSPRDLPASGHWSERLSHAARDYAQSWNARNKPSGLPDILNALAAVADDLGPPDQPMADAPNP
jgi:hypothetical protein